MNHVAEFHFSDSFKLFEDVEMREPKSLCAYFEEGIIVNLTHKKYAPCLNHFNYFLFSGLKHKIILRANVMTNSHSYNNSYNNLKVKVT